MKHVEGVRLQERCPTISGSQYMKCFQSVCMTMQQLAALEFPAYGSNYFENAPFDSTLKVPLSQGFCIGPYCSTTYWDSNASGTEKGLTIPAGPWQDLAAYSSGLVANGYSKLPSSDIDIDTSRSSYFGTVREHRNLLNATQKILQNLITQPQIKSASTPTLLHADLHARNTYVSNEDPNLITCLIDWQSSSIEPAFIYANDMPDFAALPDPRTEEESLDEATSDSEPPLSEQYIKMRKVAPYCNQAYEIFMKAFILKLRVARSVDQSLVRPFQYSNTSWRDSAAAVRQEFLDLVENWKDLRLTGECPYIPTKEELEIHRKAYKAFQHVQELKLVLIKLLHTDSDGWLPIDRWDEVRSAHKEVFNTALESAREEGSEMTEEDVRELWPFDDWKL
ncbi:2dbd963f-b27d-414c-8fdd-fa28553569e7 [Sclerotinia trifoliorum]|uniref:Altered inheritance of mitochondria protein 9, mitochondrial n=1 Tax=Sclerotinia trifoliorum TaxID=28548 RepID=A0A8H2VN36_9HELO|nr:2dbd963f-b27d-414c-8fdd-fa28553569e7 [Sclerotinia trifoliorum]